MRRSQKITVRVFLGDKEIKPSEIPNLIIKNDYVDKLVNSVYEQNKFIIDPTETA